MFADFGLQGPLCDKIWSIEAKVGKCEIDIQAKIGSKTKKYIRKQTTQIFLTLKPKDRKMGFGPNES